MTKDVIRAIWARSSGFITYRFQDEDGMCCAAGVVLLHRDTSPSPFTESGLDLRKVVVENDAFAGTPQERRDHIIALLDAGKLDA